MKSKKKISFHHHSARVRVLPFRYVSAFLHNIFLKDFNLTLYDIRFIFLSRKDIITMNRNFLKHSYATDVITFNLSEENFLECEIYICPDVVKENAKRYQVLYREELLRVILHGLLHCVGYDDTYKEGEMLMRKAEDKYMLLYNNFQKA